MNSIYAQDIIDLMMAMRNPEQEAILCRFFKSGRGEYGEGDKFLGLRVPQTRAIVKETRLEIAPAEIEKLLASEWHEIRLAGYLFLVEEMKAALPKGKKGRGSNPSRQQEIVDFYLAHAHRANNWDLVDLSAPYILGQYLLNAPAEERVVLNRLSDSANLWEQRIAVVSTIALIRQGQFDDTLRLTTKLLGHRHDLMHKAMGWMLREIGKKDKAVLEDYLEGHWAQLPRTTLRYAIERLPENERQSWLRRNH